MLNQQQVNSSWNLENIRNWVHFEVASQTTAEYTKVHRGQVYHLHTTPVSRYIESFFEDLIRGRVPTAYKK